MTMRLILTACFLMPAIIITPGKIFAHGTAHRLLDPSGTLAVSFFYSDDTPMQYAEVLVFSPADPNIEHQNGRTDKNGMFAFVPDTDGTWTITVEDGMGHAEKAQIRVAPQNAPLSPDDNRLKSDLERPALSRPVAAILGLSLILNLAGAGYCLKRRRSRD
ncbi:hypothetical protein JCM14469_39260 [Desulfatiferula olefinivorans]